MDVNETEVKSAARVLEILEFLTRSGAPASLADITVALGLPKSSAHALLRTLLLRGYVARDAAERYALVPAFRDGSWIGGRDGQLAAMARPVMEQLGRDLRETVILGARGDGGDVRIVAKIVSPEEIRYDTDMHGLRPAYCTAMGRVLLAWWDPPACEAYFARLQPQAVTPQTVTDIGRLRALVAQVRVAGVAVVEEEFALGGSGAAAPVFDGSGRAVAALNVAATTGRFPGARQRIIDAVMHGARRLSQRLGQRDGVGDAA
jgi:DNA-binding IclR family transcriptional regulator